VLLEEVATPYMPIGGPECAEPAAAANGWADPVSESAPTLHTELANRVARAAHDAAMAWAQAVAPLTPPLPAQPRHSVARSDGVHVSASSDVGGGSLAPRPLRARRRVLRVYTFCRRSGRENPRRYWGFVTPTCGSSVQRTR
jgi:hypothetical protein